MTNLYEAQLQNLPSQTPTGPDIGERLPDIAMLDQWGNSVSIESARAGRRALVVFHRSIYW